MVGGDSLLTRKTPATLNPFARQKPLLASADLAIVNVETAIGSATDRQSKEFTFRSPVRFAQLMGEAGVDIGSLANNHTLDFGDQGLIDTIDALNDAGVTPVGAGVNISEALDPSTHTINGVRVAVLAASQIIPAPSWVATKNSIGIASAGKHTIDGSTRQLLAAVTKARKSHDVVIVYMHWGKEREVCPSSVQQDLGRLLRNAGATAVVGAHPHVLQPIVRDVTDQGNGVGNGVIAYSLGNFIWDPRGGITGDSGIIELGFTGSTMTDIQFHPHRLDGYGWAAPAQGSDAKQRILGQVQRRCTGADGTGSLGAFDQPTS
jgi:poly-gamma-glutamate capsule biosynthesis protein CapA/YwtB (metallophosphatase superfamily)